MPAFQRALASVSEAEVCNVELHAVGGVVEPMGRIVSMENYTISVLLKSQRNKICMCATVSVRSRMTAASQSQIVWSMQCRSCFVCVIGVCICTDLQTVSVRLCCLQQAVAAFHYVQGRIPRLRRHLRDKSHEQMCCMEATGLIGERSSSVDANNNVQ
jgi:hypothetical protein